MFQNFQSDDSKLAGFKAAFLIFSLSTSAIYMALASTNSVESIFALKDNLYHLATFLLLSIGLSFATLVSMIATSSEPERLSIYGSSFLISCLSLLLAVAEVIMIYTNIDANLFYFFSLIISTALVYNTCQVLLTFLKTSGEWPFYISTAHAGIAFFSNTHMGIDFRHGGINEALLEMGIRVHFLIASLPLSVILLTYFFTSFRLDPSNFKSSLRKRFDFHYRERAFNYTFFSVVALEALFTIAGLAALTMLYDDSTLQANINHHLPLSQFFLSWLPVFILTLRFMREDYRENIKNMNIASLVSSQAKRFLLRYHQSNHFWSTTVGLQTASFIIDHDPDNTIAKAFPTYISHFRQNQIAVIKQIAMGNLLLNDVSIDSQIYGSIDPENSRRPCIDTLIALATLQIDGISAIEKRLKMFANLFPIIDPDLANKISSKSIEQKLSKNFWFLFIDFAWIDQSISHRQNNSSYDVHMNDVNLYDRLDLMNSLRKKERIGHIVWLSKRAKERIILEAPYLSGVIKRWMEPKHNSSIEIYFASLEDLIPRLQRYYNLEICRNRLRSYKISPESRRVIRLIESEIKNIVGIKDVYQVLNIIANYAWQGFSEKDLALGLVLHTYQTYKIFSHDDKEHQIENKFISTVEDIGYPCQDLFAAHRSKMEIRRSNVIEDICQQPRHPRFAEAWALLATINTEDNYSSSELTRLLKMIEKSIESPKTMKVKTTFEKSAVAWLNIARSLDSNDPVLVSRVFNKLIGYYAERKPSADHLSFLIDGRVFLKESQNIEVPVNYESIDKIQRFITNLQMNEKDNSAEIELLSSRWNLLKQDYKNYLQPSAIKPKAS